MSGDTTDNRTHGGRLALAGCVAILLVILYILSMPLVFAVNFRFIGPVTQPVLSFYEPVDWLYDNSSFVRVILDAEGRLLKPFIDARYKP